MAEIVLPGQKNPVLTETVKESALPESSNALSLASVVNEITANKPNLAKQNPLEFVKECGRKFMERKLDEFPRMCEIARMQNFLKRKELCDAGNPQGWSETKNFKWDFEIPSELYYFMVNMVYKKFWDEENEKIWRPFMKAICQGEDAMNLLIRTKQYYGSNKDMSLT